MIDIINAATNFGPWPRAITLIAFFALLAWVAWLVYKLLHPLVWREVEDDEQRKAKPDLKAAGRKGSV